MKKIGLLLGVLALVIFIGSLILYFNPNLNYFALKSVEKNAIAYIKDTYPDFEISNITVTHEWKSNQYVVLYNNSENEERELRFDHTGKNLFSDAYISRTAWNIVYDYEKSIEQKISAVLTKNTDYKIYNITIKDNNVNGKDREIALEGVDISNDTVECTVSISGEDGAQASDFAQKSLVIYDLIRKENLPIVKIWVIQHNAPDSRFDIIFPADMRDLTIEEVEVLVQE